MNDLGPTEMALRIATIVAIACGNAVAVFVTHKQLRGVAFVAWLIVTALLFTAWIAVRRRERQRRAA